MTVVNIHDGLMMLVARLANNEDTTTPPDGWELHEWTYIKGIATAQILQLRDRLLQRRYE